MRLLTDPQELSVRKAAEQKARMSQSIVLSSDPSNVSPIKLEPVKKRTFDLAGGKKGGLS